MIELRRHDWALGAALLAGLGGVLLSPVGSWFAAGAAGLCGVVTAAHILMGDEVERSRNFKAAAIAFALCVGALVVVTAAGRTELIAAAADRLWAAGFTAYLAGWIGVRVVRA